MIALFQRNPGARQSSIYAQGLTDTRHTVTIFCDEQQNHQLLNGICIVTLVAHDE